MFKKLDFNMLTVSYWNSNLTFKSETSSFRFAALRSMLKRRAMTLGI